MLTIAIIGILVFVSVFIFGIGVTLLIERVWSINGPYPSPPTIDKTFFYGLSALVVACGWLSLVSPINEFALLGYLIVVVITALCVKKRIAHYLSLIPSIKPTTYGALLMLAALGVLLLLALDFSFMGIIYYDSGLYHIQSIDWIRNYAVVPGLGNLHDRLAFNSMVFPLHALFAFFPSKWLILPLNFVVVGVLAGRLIWNSHLAILDQKSRNAFFYMIVLGLFIALNVRQIYSASTDLFSGVLVLYILLLILEKPSEDRLFNHSDLLVVLLMMISVTVKLSTAPILLFLLYYSKDFDRKKLLKLAFTAILVFSPFLIRNYILSGYLIFPFPAVDLFNPDWKVPVDTVATTRDAIKAWARVPRVDSQIVLEMSFLQWLPQWWENLKPTQQILVLINAVAIPLMAFRHFHHSNRLKWFHAVLMLYLIFWFFTAPDPRFAESILIYNTAYLFCLLIPIGQRFNFKVMYSFFAVAIFIWTVQEYQVIFASAKQPMNWIVPRSSIKQPEVRYLSTNFSYAVPVTNNQCHSAPIPCTPYPNDHLVLRNSTLSSGFRIDPQYSDQ